MIEVKNLRFSYSKRQPAVFDDFSIRFDDGKIYGLLGKNGTGKSTLLYLLSGLLPPRMGEVRYNGIDVGLRLPSVLSEMFIVPEVYDVPDRTIVKYARELAKFYPRFDHEFLNFCIKEFELEADKSMQKMSMGQKKKAFVSIALSSRPRLLLMDEPSNGLDIPSKSQFRKVIASGADERSTVIISTHQAHDIENLIDHICIIDNSRLLLDSSVETIGERLVLRVQPMGAPADGALFSQPVLGGYVVVYPAENAPEGCFPVDLETLFNAVHTAPQQFTHILRSHDNGNKQ